MSFIQKKNDVSLEDIARLVGVFSGMNATSVWSKVTAADFTVERFELGFVNDISLCKLTADAQKRLCTSSDDISAIVVKFTSENSLSTMNSLERVAINVAMSEQKITPRLLYVNEECMINEFVQSRDYCQKDDFDLNTVQDLARILARIHSTKPPISSNGIRSWEDVWEDSEGKNPTFQAVLNKEYLLHLERETKDVKEKYYSVFTEIDFPQLAAFNRTLIQALGSPIVFSHVDFARSNRLVKEKALADGSIEKELYIIDFEYSTYTYRGMDLGRYFANYQHVGDCFGNEGFPEDEEMKPFLEEYRSECARIEGPGYLNDKANSMEQLNREVKVFTLSAYVDFFFCLVLYTTNPCGPEKDRYLKFAFDRYSSYQIQKQRFINDGTIPSLLNYKHSSPTQESAFASEGA